MNALFFSFSKKITFSKAVSVEDITRRGGLPRNTKTENWATINFYDAIVYYIIICHCLLFKEYSRVNDILTFFDLQTFSTGWIIFSLILLQCKFLKVEFKANNKIFILIFIVKELFHFPYIVSFLWYLCNIEILSALFFGNGLIFTAIFFLFPHFISEWEIFLRFSHFIPKILFGISRVFLDKCKDVFFLEK